MDKDKKPHAHSAPPGAKGSDMQSAPEPATTPELEEFFRKLKPEMRRPKPSSDAIAAALESAQRLASEADSEEAAETAAQHFSGSERSRNRSTHNSAAVDFAGKDSSGDDSPGEATIVLCGVCGHRNRSTNRFCGMCGVVIEGSASASAGPSHPAHEISLGPDPFLDSGSEDEPRVSARRSQPDYRASSQTRPEEYLEHAERHADGHPETHHYHHHYHHHYFPGGQEGIASSVAPRAADPAREAERFRSTTALRGDMSRAEATVRRIAQEWVVACNTKHLDDLLELYVADALVLRSNLLPIRGAAAVREFFFGALDSGLGEVELEPLRVEVVGDLAYEAGRCKALVPSATGKRREERGKYLWVCARQSGGEWKLTADCWSSDLTLSTLESDVPASAPVRTSQPRKN